MEKIRQAQGQRVAADQLQILSAGTNQTVVVTLAVAAVFLGVHTPGLPDSTGMAWLIALTAVLLVRGLLGHRFLISVDSRQNLAAWRRAFRGGALTTGLLWGAAGIMYFPLEAVEYQIFTVLVLAGLAAGALTVLAVDFTAYLGYTVSILGPVALQSLYLGDRIHLAVGILVVFLLLFLLRAGRRLSESIHTSLQLRYENQALLEQLEQDKARLDSRLERILKDSSSELYVFDADSLLCLQANAGAGQNLGLAPELLTGRHMLEILHGMDAQAFQELVQPLRAGQQDYVVYDGRHRRRDGSSYPVQAHIQLSRQEQPAVFVTTALDVSERERAERLARERQMFMETVIAKAPVVLWAIDMQGNLSFIQNGDTHLPGADAELSVGDNLFRRFEHSPQLQGDIQRALSGEVFSSDLELESAVWEIHYSPINEDGQQAGVIGVGVDVTDRKAYEKKLIQQANFDELTGLPNKTYMMSRVEDAFASARRQNHRVALMFLDLDNFKNINDTLGHKTGDLLLQESARRLSAALRDSDCPSRLSGDEFLIMLEQLQRPEDAAVVAGKLIRAFERPFQIADREVFITVSIGVTFFPDDGQTVGNLLQYADTAMYYAKEQGRNNYQLFTREMREAADERLNIESHLRRALEKQEFFLLYQPKVDGEGSIRGAEALLRWHNPQLGMVSPAKFIPIAEDSGLIDPIGSWVLEQACRDASRWQEEGHSAFTVAVNVSSRQFRSGSLLAAVQRALDASGLKADALELEITESLLVQDAPETMQMLHVLRASGVTLALDDFGTGYSALGYLKRFPMQVLKIDQSFVRDLGVDPNDEALVDAIIAMAHSLNLKVVAEGVETQTQLDFLTGRQVELIQGYLTGRPMPREELEQLLTASLAPESTVA